MNGRYRNCAISCDEVRGSIGTMLLERSIEWHTHPVFAFRKGDGYEHITWYTLLRDVVSIVDFLNKKKITKGDRIAVLSPNNYSMLAWELAVASMGAISVPIFAKYDVKHIDHILTNSEPVAMFIEGEERLA
ncbi:MAG: long-chain fatty acid--CoA ligase, partial [bacterium]|nr:long-chain fatty acid--CoA ligase [bacterium]